MPRDWISLLAYALILIGVGGRSVGWVSRSISTAIVLPATIVLAARRRRHSVEGADDLQMTNYLSPTAAQLKSTRPQDVAARLRLLATEARDLGIEFQRPDDEAGLARTVHAFEAWTARAYEEIAQDVSKEAADAFRALGASGEGTGGAADAAGTRADCLRRLSLYAAQLPALIERFEEQVK